MPVAISAYVGLALSAVAVLPNMQNGLRTSHEAGPRCTAREVSRKPLVVEGGKELFVEPVVFTVSGDRVLLAGKPSYLFAERPEGVPAALESRDAVFGAVIDADGSARTVPAPPVNGGQAAAVAGAALDGGRWRVIFAALDFTAAESLQTVNEFWHGIYDGTHWSALERLPKPAGKQLLYYNRSALAQHGDTVMWAALAHISGTRQGIVVFERSGGVWSYRIPPTRFASGVELVHTPSLGFVLAAKHGDRPESLFWASVFFYKKSSNWELYREVQAGPDQNLLRATLDFFGDEGVLTWLAPADTGAAPVWELRAMVGEIVSRDEPVFVVHKPARRPWESLNLGRAGVVWLTGHGADRAGPGDLGELRLLRRVNDSTEVLWRTPQPYLGPVAAAPYSETDLLIAGPQLDKPNELLVSLILRLRVTCDSTKPPAG